MSKLEGDERTTVDLDGRKGTASVAGPAWAVITIIAVLGLIVISIRALDIGRAAIMDGPPKKAETQENQ